MIIDRKEDIKRIKRLVKNFPVTAILGPRQCGKTFLAKLLKADYYFDLENPRDLKALETPQTTLEHLQGLIVIDEIQRVPNLFSTMRYLVDTLSKQKYIILGSASRDLLRQSAESLAGRISYHYLSGFSLKDIGKEHWRKLWIRGGFPKAYLSSSQKMCDEWLDNYITTFLERDIPQLGITIPAQTLRKFWMMLSHYHGQIINCSEIGRAFGVSDMSVRKYIDILESAFMIRVLQPWYENLGKRLVKRPKLYFRDSGIFHRFLTISSQRDLVSHPKVGASWEGFAMEVVIRKWQLKPQEIFFWGTHGGAEVDLLWKRDGKTFAAEFKYSDAPSLTPSMKSVVKDLKLEKLYVFYPGDRSYKLSSNVETVTIDE